MSNRLSRTQLIEHLKARFEGESIALAAWLGGSDASGRLDRYSDIDFQVIVEEGCVERAFEILHDSLNSLGEIELRHRLPEPTWHGFSQEFLRMADADPHHFIDFVVMPASTPPSKRVLEVERHGRAQVLFDRGGWVTEVRLDGIAHGARMRERLKVLRVTFELFGVMITRSVARGFPVEAASFYQRFALAPLVELLRMRHCPDRFDFGLRYLDRDLGEADRSFVESLAFPRDGEDCERLRLLVAERFERELAELDAGGWSLPQSD